MRNTRHKTRARRRGRLLPSLILLLALFGASGVFESLSQPTAVQNGYLVSGVNKNAALAQAAGEFRIVAANLLWTKVVDHYHHQYLAQGGDWSKNESLLPLLHTIIILDPHFVQAYSIMGDAILPKTGHLAEGRAVLALGIKNNPNEPELYRQMAILYAWNDHKPAQALPYAQTGLAVAQEKMAQDRQAKLPLDDDDFACHILSKLCHTLQDQVRTQAKAEARQARSPITGEHRRPA